MESDLFKGRGSQLGAAAPRYVMMIADVEVPGGMVKHALGSIKTPGDWGSHHRPEPHNNRRRIPVVV
jgi:hypothetical protein